MMFTTFNRLTIAAMASCIAGGLAAQEITGAGSTFVAPLIAAWAEARSDAGPTVSYDAIGSGAGVQAFSEGEVDFGATEQPLDDDAVEMIEGGVIHLPVTASMIALAYNVPGLDSPLRLGRETLVGIFAGRITTWNDPEILADNPGGMLPDRDIALVTRRDSSGTSFAFAAHLAAIDPAFGDTGPGVNTLPAWPSGAMTALGNEGVAARINQAEYSIGYVEHGFARRLGLPLAEIENGSGNFVAPAPEAGSTALAAEADKMPVDGRQLVTDPRSPGAYPIVTYTWVLLRAETAEDETSLAIRDFFGWATGAEGQALAAAQGYVPLPPPVEERAAAMIETLR